MHAAVERLAAAIENAGRTIAAAISAGDAEQPAKSHGSEFGADNMAKTRAMR